MQAGGEVEPARVRAGREAARGCDGIGEPGAGWKVPGAWSCHGPGHVHHDFTAGGFPGRRHEDWLACAGADRVLSLGMDQHTGAEEQEQHQDDQNRLLGSREVEHSPSLQHGFAQLGFPTAARPWPSRPARH